MENKEQRDTSGMPITWEWGEYKTESVEDADLSQVEISVAIFE